MKKSVILLSFCMFLAVCPAHAKDFYVSLSGDDSWSGELPEPNGSNTDGPFKTLEKARDAIRQLKNNGGLPKGGVTVSVRGGVYMLTQMFLLSQEDAGTEDAPIVYATYAGEEVHFLGGKTVTGFTTVTDETVLNRFQETARGNILQADLKAQGITNYGTITQSDGPGMNFFFRSEQMTLARYPNEGWLTMLGVPLTCKEPFVGDYRTVRPDGTSDGMHCGKFMYSNPLAAPINQMIRPEQWAPADDIWMLGFWYWDWSSMYQKVESIDTKKKEIYFTPPYHFYGYRGKQRYYFFNVLEELDMPGEWYLDRTNGILYFWPPAPIDSGEAFVSTMQSVIVNLNNASYVTVRGFLFEGTRKGAIVVNDGTYNVVDGCTVRNIGGDMAISINGGTENGVINCVLYDLAGGGINLSGGDRKTLTPGGNYAINNDIHHFANTYKTYHAGIHINGVGNRMAHNLIYDAPHAGAFFSGNEHIIEYNEIHDIALETHDVGGIYNGRDWTQRGTIIRYNFFHHNMNAYCIYFDDLLGGNTVYGNVIYKGGIGVLIGGGRNNTVENNIIIECGTGLYVDGRGLYNNYFDPSAAYYDATIADRMKEMKYDQPPYSEKYPELAVIYDDEPKLPKYNTITRNIFYGGSFWYIQDNIKQYITRANNMEGKDPLFVDFTNMNFQLKDDSPAYTEIGFERIPFEEIGLLKEPINVSVKENHPEAVKLEQNTPNPFNPVTAIHFSIPKTGMVKLSVYNMLGQQVAKLADGRFTAGAHSVTFDGGGLASGIYFYRLKYGDYVKTRKMLMIK